jgi:hypothetical protein
VVRGHEVVAQPDVVEGLKDFDDAGVVLVFRGHQREQKSGVDEGHSRGRP